jgi:uncharacterized membrane protein (DUF4010 family)
MYQQLVPFLTAAVIGLLIGIERERSKNRDGKRSMLGARTLPLIALLGGLMAFLDHYALMIIVSVFVGVVVLASDAAWDRESGAFRIGGTTAVAAMLTYVLGYLAQTDVKVAVVLAVLLFGFLSVKSRLHSFAQTGITKNEMSAVLTFLISAFVILPLLPNHFVDPWELIHPTRIWMLFVLITGVEFCSYIALRQLGKRWGTLLSGLLGGAVSATATTLTLARRIKDQPHSLFLISSGIVLAEVSSLLIQIIVLGVIAPDVFVHLYMFLAGPAAIGVLSAVGIAAFSRQENNDPPVEISIANPISFKSTLSFALLISLGLILIALAARWFGSVGVYVTSALGGVASLRVVTFSVSELTSAGDISITVAALAILIAMTTNMLMKLVIIFRAGRMKLVSVCALFFLLMLVGGALVFFFNPFYPMD